MSGTLVVGPAWIGDMVMAHCLVQHIHNAFAGQPIAMVAPPATAAIASRMAEVSEIHPLAAGHGELGLGKRYRLGRALAARKFERSFVLPNSWKSALVPFFARIPRRTGWLGEARYGLLNDTAVLPAGRLPLMIERFMALMVPEAELARPYPQPRLEVDAEQQAAVLLRLGLSAAQGAVALCPGAEFGPAKRWPIEHFAEVASQVVGAGRDLWLLGGAADRAVCQQIAQRVTQRVTRSSGAVINIAGKTSLTEVVDVLAAAAAVVCNDSGLMHVACAVNTPVVALYGSTSPEFTPPLHPDALALTLVELDNGMGRLACQPCFQRSCRFEHGNCLALLHPRHVTESLQSMGILARVADR